MAQVLNSNTEERKLPYSKLALNLEYIGPATASKEVWHWDIAPIEDGNGVIHLFLGEWKDDFTNWYKNAALAHYTAPSPEGPYTFRDYAITPDQLPGEYTSIFNGHMKKIDDEYVLIYTASSYHGDREWTLSNQAVCMAHSKSLDGPWEFYGQDGTVIRKSNDPSDFSYGSCCGCVNPCMEKIGDRYWIFYRCGKTRGRDMKYCAAVSDSLLGTYVPQGAVTDNINYIEDGDCFLLDGTEYLLTTDNTGGNTLGFSGDIFGRRDNAFGILWKMQDGKFSLKNAKVGYGLLSDYISDMSHATCPEFGAFDKVERPAFLIQNGKPTYLYCCAYTSVEGTGMSQTYVFKIHGLD